MQQSARPIEVLLDATANGADRATAAAELARSDEPAAVDALVRLACDASLPEGLLRPVGAAIGEIWFRNGVRDVEIFASMATPAREDCIGLLFEKSRD